MEARGGTAEEVLRGGLEPPGQIRKLQGSSYIITFVSTELVMELRTACKIHELPLRIVNCWAKL